MPETRFPGSGGFRIRPYRPVRTVLLAGVTLAVTMAAVWGAYRLGLRDGGHAAAQARATEAHLRIQVADLRDQVGELHQRNTLLARAERIERDAREHLREMIERRDQRIAALEEELTFYRNIVSPSKMDPGLQIRRVSLKPAAGLARTYRYELVLSQLNGGKRYAEGEVDLRLDGQQEGEPASFSFTDLTLEDTVETEFRFKYFQTLTGRVQLPEEFEPRWLKVNVRPTNGFDPLEESHAWGSVVPGGG